MKTIKAWCCKNPNGELMVRTISVISEESCENFTRDLFSDFPEWVILKGDGYKAVQVEIREIPDD